MIIDVLLEYAYIAIAALIAIVLHELAHGLVSYMLGDPTPKRQGRLSLNPLKHLDPIGTLCLVFFHVGWAKPVMVNPEYYKHRRLGMALVALAGPLMNFILAIVSTILMGLVYKISYANNLNVVIENIIYILFNFFQALAIINLGLGLFNLLPIPPLDGSKILGSFLKGNVYEQYMKYQRYGFLILTGILLLSMLAGGGMSFITRAVSWLFNLMWRLVCLMFGLV